MHNANAISGKNGGRKNEEKVPSWLSSISGREKEEKNKKWRNGEMERDRGKRKVVSRQITNIQFCFYSQSYLSPLDIINEKQ